MLKGESMKKITNNELLIYYVNKYSLYSYLNKNLLNSLEIHTFNKNEFLCLLNDKLSYMYFLVKILMLTVMFKL